MSLEPTEAQNISTPFQVIEKAISNLQVFQAKCNDEEEN